MNKISTIVICGCSSSGKDHLFKRLISETDLKATISHTTRPQRANEPNSTYHFISEEEFDIMVLNNEFIEHRTYKTKKGTWRYALSKQALSNNDGFTSLIILDIQGLEELQRNTNGKNIHSIYLEVSPSSRLIRSINRQSEEIDLDYNSLIGDKTVEEIIRRYGVDKRDFSNAKSVCNTTLSNESLEDLERNIEYIKSLI